MLQLPQKGNSARFVIDQYQELHMSSEAAKSHLNAEAILQVLDQSAAGSAFPMLDNGYVYLAASRLSAFRSELHWAIVFEIFGFSPRAEFPNVAVHTISSDITNRKSRNDYLSGEAYELYLRDNPNWETKFFWPVSNDEWIDKLHPEHVGQIGKIILRDETLKRPEKADYEAASIKLADGAPHISDLCRYLAHTQRQKILATDAERRSNISAEMKLIIALDEWHHPDLAADQLPSQIKTFQNLAIILEKNDPSLYEEYAPPNNHWKNWPDGGSL